MTDAAVGMAAGHRVVSGDDWLVARLELLAAEKEFTRLRDQLSRRRRELPWERVEKAYAFDTSDGRRTLRDLFGDHSQLVVYHFMFGPDWDEGCPSCSFWADNFDGIDVHLAQRDVRLVAASRAPVEMIQAFQRRMGWRFTWVSSAPSDFNVDFNASFTPEAREAGTALFNFREGDPGVSDREGVSVFKRDGDDVFRTYSCYARGIDMLNGAYHFLDLVPGGRGDEVKGNPQAWVRHHDRYGG